DAAVMLRDRRVDQLAAMRLERIQRPDLVGAHQPAVADHIGSENRGEPALHCRLLPKLSIASHAANDLRNDQNYREAKPSFVIARSAATKQSRLHPRK